MSLAIVAPVALAKARPYGGAMRQSPTLPFAASKRSPRGNRLSLPVILALALLVLTALMGGSSRADTVSLLFLRPLSIALAAWAIFRLKKDDRAGFGGWLVLLACTVGLLLLHLVPMPPSMWHLLPGREIVIEIDKATGLNPWRPISLDPQLTRNALWSLAAPAAAFIFALQADRSGRAVLYRAMLAVGLASGLLGVIQFASGPDSPLYWYRISNFGSAVGFFSNRNHEGVFLACQFPLLAAFAVTGPEKGRETRMIAAAAVAAVIVPMILITGSRAGLLTGVVGLLGAAILLRPHLDLSRGNPARRSRLLVAGVLAAAFLVFCAIYIGLNQGNSVDRIVGGADSQTELRWPIWEATLVGARAMFPFGSGVGTFTSVFDMYEPDAILGPSYINHAHNDYLEIFMNAGIPGLVLLAAGLWLIFRDAWRVWRRSPHEPAVIIGRAAAIALILLILASAFDYPLRTPLMSVFAAFLIFWLRRGAIAARASASSPSA